MEIRWGVLGSLCCNLAQAEKLHYPRGAIKSSGHLTGKRDETGLTCANGDSPFETSTDEVD